MILFQRSILGFAGHWDYSTGAPPVVEHGTLKRTVLALANQDAGAFGVFALAALPAYMLFEGQLRYFHTACAIVCFFALAASTSRAGVVSLSLALGITLLYAGPRYRVRIALFTAFLVLAVALAPMLPPTLPGSRPLENLRLAVLGAARGPSVDPTSQFRIIRWRYTFKRWMSHPIFGEGFGTTIVPYALWETNERMGVFNRGMPHNTFLFVADRMGIVGLALVLFCWFLIVGRLLAAMGSIRRADNLAAANILAAMFGFAIFVLFFERPVTNAAFWIILAAGARLAERQTAAPTGTLASGQHALYLHGA
jgi:O-antigen ligase